MSRLIEVCCESVKDGFKHVLILWDLSIWELGISTFRIISLLQLDFHPLPSPGTLFWSSSASPASDPPPGFEEPPSPPPPPALSCVAPPSALGAAAPPTVHTCKQL